MVLRELTMDDLRDKLTIKGTLLDILAATAERAEEIYQIEIAQKAREITPPPPRKRSRERTAPRIISHDNGHGKGKKHRSTSSASKKKKSNSLKKKDNPPPLSAEVENPPLPPRLPAEVENAIGAISSTVTAVKLVMQKVLTATDVNSTQSRLLIPFNQILTREDFLKEEEKRHLRLYEEGRRRHKKFKWVNIFEPSLAMATVKLRRWDMGPSSSYIINGEWNGIVKRNHLEKGTKIQLWCFRVDKDLCFALVRLN